MNPLFSKPCHPMAFLLFCFKMTYFFIWIILSFNHLLTGNSSFFQQKNRIFYHNKRTCCHASPVQNLLFTIFDIRLSIALLSADQFFIIDIFVMVIVSPSA